MAKKIDGYTSCKSLPARRIPRPRRSSMGQKGVNIMEFCKAFNAETQGVEPGLPIPVVILSTTTNLSPSSKTPPASVLLKKIAGIKSGSGRPNTEKVAKVTRAQLKR